MQRWSGEMALGHVHRWKKEKSDRPVVPPPGLCWADQPILRGPHLVTFLFLFLCFYDFKKYASSKSFAKLPMSNFGIDLYFCKFIKKITLCWLECLPANVSENKPPSNNTTTFFYNKTPTTTLVGWNRTTQSL
jgi:hypothetical protein